MRRRTREAVWSTAKINDLPDSSFLYIEPGGTKDGEGKTTPRSLRHFPYKDESGKVDLPHLRNALARIPQSGIPAAAKARALAKARAAASKAGIKVSTEGTRRDPSDPRMVTLKERVFGGLKGVEGRTILGVAMLNSESSNDRFYLPDTMTNARALFERAQMFVDHPGGDPENPEPRSARDLLGRFEGIGVEPTGEGKARMFGNLKVYPGADGDRLLEIAKSAPDAFGCSINARGTVVQKNGVQIVTSIDRVFSVDLVAEPATTKGIFESQTTASEDQNMADLQEQLTQANATIEELEAQKGDAEKELGQVKTELDELKKKVAGAERREQIEKAIRESGIPAEQITDTFRAALERCDGDEQVKAMLDDRKAALGDGEPESREQRPLGEKGESVRKLDELETVLTS